MRKTTKLVALLTIIATFLNCIPLKERKLLQPSDLLELNENGKVDVLRHEHQIQVDDILTMDLIAVNQSDLAKFGSIFSDGVTNASDNAFYVRGLIVDGNGDIEIPHLGKVSVLNNTIPEAQRKITNKLTETEFKEGAIFVKLQLSGINYSIIGEVVRPNSYIVYRNRINLIDVIARSGDFTDVADRKNIKLIRQTPEGLKIVSLDITSENIINSEYFYIHPNDQIIVNPKYQKVLGTGVNTLGTIATTFALITGAISTITILSRL